MHYLLFLRKKCGWKWSGIMKWLQPSLVTTVEWKTATLYGRQQLWGIKTETAAHHTHINLCNTINTSTRRFGWISVRNKYTTQQHIRQSEMLATTKGLGNWEAVISTKATEFLKGEQRGFCFLPCRVAFFFNISLSRQAACEAAPHGRACLHKPEGTVLEGFVPNPSTLPAGLFVPATSRLEGWRADSRPPSGLHPSHGITSHLVAITELQPGRHPEGRAKSWRVPISASWAGGRPDALPALHYRKRRTVYISPVRDWGMGRAVRIFLIFF